jgi:N-acetyl-gamma-glutamyl-phosphate reductase
LPEVFGDAIKSANLIANPGCYPTCVILAGAPLIAAGLGFPENMIADCLSGISGAGRGATAETHYCSSDESVSTYKAGGTHQHIPEMELYLGLASNEQVNITFTPHLAPFSRGIYGTVYADIKDNADLDKIHKAYVSYYAGSHFVKVLPKGEYPRLKAVAGSNFCHIGLAVDERAGRAIIVSAIDNLVKGASGQAIQNMNIMFGLPEETGLEAFGIWP